MREMREFQALIALGRLACREDSPPSLKEALEAVIRGQSLLPEEWAGRSGRELHRELYRRWRGRALPLGWIDMIESVLRRDPVGWIDYLQCLEAGDVSTQERLTKLLLLKDQTVSGDPPETLPKIWEFLDQLSREIPPPRPRSKSSRRAASERDGLKQNQKAISSGTDGNKPKDFFTRSQQDAFDRIATMASLYYNSNTSGMLTPRLSPLIAGPTGSGKTAVVSEIASSLGSHLLRLTVGEWIPQGASREHTPSLNLVCTALANHKRIVCFIDELDKFCDDGRTWSRSCLTEIYGLLERMLPESVLRQAGAGVGDRAKVVRNLRSGLFIVGAGAWQNLHDRPPKKSIGFGSGSGSSAPSETPLLLRAIRETGFPPELLGRFHSKPIHLSYPASDETDQIFGQLGLAELASRTRQEHLLREFSWSPFGLRSLESLYADLLIADQAEEQHSRILTD